MNAPYTERHRHTSRGPLTWLAPATGRSVLMVVANPTTSSTTGWAVGFWAAELFHPLYEFTKARYRVDGRKSRWRQGRDRRPLRPA